MWTVKHGIISEASLARMRELFSEIGMEAVIPLFTEMKKRYLWSRDLETVQSIRRGTRAAPCGAAALSWHKCIMMKLIETNTDFFAHLPDEPNDALSRDTPQLSGCNGSISPLDNTRPGGVP